ncbi:MAG: hypothetical protein U0587_21665 [Candidatus Binatia bacterium]
MPRQARLDAPGVLHHVMVRGIERRAIFLDDTDRQDFVDRLAGLSQDTVVPIFAWSLLPQPHPPLAAQHGGPGLSALMRRLLTGYAVRSTTDAIAAAGTCFKTASIHLVEDRAVLSGTGALSAPESSARSLGHLGLAGTGHPVEWPRATGRAGERWLAGRGGSTGAIRAGAGRARQAYRAFVAPEGFTRARPELMGEGSTTRSLGLGAYAEAGPGAGALGL